MVSSSRYQEQSMNADHKLQKLVLDALDYDPNIDCSHIGVAARDGIVTLSGHVASNPEKRAAELAAGRVVGVKAVVDDLLVELPGRNLTPDETIAERCYEMIAALSSIPLDRIHLSVSEGVVTVHGDVDYLQQRVAVEAELWGLSCVRGLTNEVVVLPPVKTDVVREKVRQVLSSISPINAEKLEVRAVGTRVTLKGTVNSWHEKGLAESAVWSVPGVTGIDDQIVVLG